MPIAISFFLLILAWLQFRRSSRFQQENLRLQERLVNLEQRRDDRQRIRQTNQKKEQKQHLRDDISRYLHYVDKRFRYLDFTGLNAILQKPLLLEQIYVKLRARPTLCRETFQSIRDFQALQENSAQKENEDEDEAKAAEEFTAVFEKLLTEQKPIRCLILGQPGSGKTTLMKWIALMCARKEMAPFASFCPVFISLKDLTFLQCQGHTELFKKCFGLDIESDG